MYNNLFKIVPLVAISFLFCLLPSVGTTEVETIESKETKLEIPPVSNKGVTIVLRAPTSQNLQLLKYTADKDGKVKQPVVLDQRKLLLPRNTPVFFRVDQVNTLLYNVEISVEEKELKEEKAFSIPNLVGIVGNFNKIIKEIQTAISIKSRDDTGLKTALRKINNQLQAMKELNEKIESILMQSENPQFSDYHIIKSQVSEATKSKFGLTNGTSEELSAYIAAVIAEVQKIYADNKDRLPDDFKKKTEEITKALNETLKLLRTIETATWRKDDKQERILKDEIVYTCALTPAIKLSGGFPELKSDKIVFRVSRQEEKIIGPKVTIGSFYTPLHDETYFKHGDGIVEGVQDPYSLSSGLLVHLPIFSDRISKVRGGLAFSGGLGLSGITQSDGSSKLGEIPVTLGFSLLLAGTRSDSMLSLTYGIISKPVELLNGNLDMGIYPMEGKLTRPVHQKSHFFALTVSYDILELLRREKNKE